MKKFSAIGRILMFAMCMTSILSGYSQNIGEISYRRVFGGSGGLCKLAYKNSGDFYAGDIIKEFPDGTIVEAKHIGRGYYTTKYFDFPEEGILYGTEDVKPEHADPKKAIGHKFECQKYAVQFPSLGDLPTAIETISVETNPDTNTTIGNAIIKINLRENPGTSQENDYTTICYGNFLPYCISITHILNNGQITPITENRIYTNVRFDGTISAIYINGYRYNIIQ